MSERALEAGAANLAEGRRIRLAKAAAREFMVWREAEAVSWDTSIGELAKALGMDKSTVRNIVVRRGWAGRLRGEKGSDAWRKGYAVRMRDETSDAADVVDLIGREG